MGPLSSIDFEGLDNNTLFEGVLTEVLTEDIVLWVHGNLVPVVEKLVLSVDKIAVFDSSVAMLHCLSFDEERISLEVDEWLFPCLCDILCWGLLVSLAALLASALLFE